MRVGTLNIRNGRAGNLEAALRGLEILGIDIVVITETKFDNEKYPRLASGYEIYATKAPSNRRGGVAFAVRKDRGDSWEVEDLSIDSGNVISCTLVSGEQRTRLIGVYLSPTEYEGETLDVLSQVAQAADDPVMMLGDFNANLSESGEARRRGPANGEGGRGRRQ